MSPRRSSMYSLTATACSSACCPDHIHSFAKDSVMSTRLSLIKKSAAILLALGLTGAAFAALKTNPAKSSISATFKQMNVPVDGKFKKFNAQIDYDAAKPEASKANVEIEVASFDLGDA